MWTKLLKTKLLKLHLNYFALIFTGIGRAIAVKLYELGATVYAVSKSPDTLASLKSECPNVITVPVDLGDWNATRAALGPLPVTDCLVNNAGVCKAATFQDTTPEDLDL